MESGPDMVRRYRSAKDWDQTQLAQASGVNLSTLQKAEQGKHRPRRPTVQMLDDALEARGELLAAFGYQDAPTHTWDGRTPDDLASLVAEVREFLTLAKQRRSDIDDMLAEAREVSAAARDASEGMADLVLAVAEIRDFVRRREAALARRPGELEP